MAAGQEIKYKVRERTLEIWRERSKDTESHYLADWNDCFKQALRERVSQCLSEMARNERN